MPRVSPPNEKEKVKVMQKVKLFQVVMFLVAALMAMFLGMKAASAQTKEGCTVCKDDPVPVCKAGERVSFYPSYCKTVVKDGCKVRVYRTIRKCIPDAKVIAKERDQARTERDEARARIASLEAEVTKLKEQVTQFGEENSALKARISELEKEVARLKSQATSIGEENSALKAKITALEEQVTAMQAEIDRLQAENTKLRGPYHLQLALEEDLALRVVDPPCKACKNAFFHATNFSFLYEWWLLEEFGLATGLVGRIGVGANGEFYGGGGALLQAALYPESSRTLVLAADIRGIYEGNKEVSALNFDVGFGIGVKFNPGIGVLVGVRYSRLGMTDQSDVPWFMIRVFAGIPGTN